MDQKTGPDASLLDALRGGAALKLRADDAADLAVMSALLQDAVAPLGDLAPVPADQAFIGMFNRYCWERPEGGARTLCALTIGHVARARLRGVDRARPTRLLNLLALRVAEPDDRPAALELTFAQGAAIRLEVEKIALRLEDVGEDWPTRFRPAHGAG